MTTYNPFYIPVGFDDDRIAGEAWLAYAAKGDVMLQLRVLKSAFPQRYDKAIRSARFPRFVTSVARELADGHISIEKAVETTGDYAAKL